MPKQMLAIFITALLSSGIFLIIVRANLDYILLFLSTMPLFSDGLSKEPKRTLEAGALATFIIAVLTFSFLPAALFFLIFALPCWYICHLVSHYRDIKLNPGLPATRIWYPIGLLTLHLAIYGCALLAITTAFFATRDTNLPQLLSKIIQDTITILNKDYKIELDIIEPGIAIADLTFMLCGFSIWFWALILLGHAWVVNNALVKKNLAKRPNLIVTPFYMPYWLLTFMGICALASLIGGESMRFLGKSSLIILLLPYFFQGTAILHINSRNWPNRWFFLFLFYFSIAILLWPALVVAGVGLWHHIKSFNKHLSSNGS